MKVKKQLKSIAQYVPQSLVLLSVLTSNVFFPALAIAEELPVLEERSNEVVVDVPVDESEDILDEGIATSIYEEEEVVEEEAVEPLFVYEDGVYTVHTVVEGEEYVYPDNENVRITFNEVTEEGNLVIERVELTEEQREELNTTDVYGWDISSTMSNGSFKYDLTLPNTQGNDVEVKYTEDGSNYESVERVNVSDGIVELRGLDHFTTFVVSGVDNSGSCTGASITEPSGTTACYTTIQEAVNNATIGDTIYVSSGTHTLNSQLVISKDLTIVGDDKDNTIIVPSFNTSSFSWNDHSNSLILINNNAIVNLSDITIDGNGYDVAIAIRVEDSSNTDIERVDITNIKHAQYLGFGITYSNSTGNANSVTMSNIERVGIESQFGSDININDFTYTGKGDGDYLDYGIEVGRGAKATIKGSDISKCGSSTTAWESAAILVSEAKGPDTEAVIENNYLHNNASGLHVGYGDTDTSEVEASGNTFENNYHQIHVSSGNINLEEALSDNIFDRAVVVRENPIKVPVIFSNIQNAINHADEGDIIQVLPGTYNENISIDKGLRLIGEDRDTTIISPTSGKVIDIKAQTYTIDGLTIQGFTLLPQDASIALQSNSGVNNGFDGSNYLYKDLIIDENDFAQSAVGLFDVDTVTLDNVVVTNSTRTTGGAIEIVGVKDLAIINSKIVNNEIGLKVFSVAGYETNTNFEIHNSTFDNNKIYGILNEDSGLIVNAPNNWWGHITGPSGESFGRGDKVSTNVDICPWLKSENGDPVETCEVSKPNVNFVSPEDNAFVAGQFDVTVEAEDNWGMGSYYIRLWENGPYVSQGGILIEQCSQSLGDTRLGTSRTDSCTFDSTGLTEGGDYYITAQYLNSLSKWGSDVIKINIDNTKPVVELTSIVAGEYYRKDIDFSGTIIEDNPKEYRFYLRYMKEDGTKPSVYNSGWLPIESGFEDQLLYEWNSITSKYGDGKYRVRLDARDQAGNWDKDLIVIYVDNTRPEAEILNPTTFTYTNDTISFNGRAKDENLRRIYLELGDKNREVIREGNNRVICSVIDTGDITNPDWNNITCTDFDLSSYPEGTYSMILEAWDMSWNYRKDSILFRLDRTSPTSELNVLADHYEHKNKDLFTSWRGFQWFYNFTEVELNLLGEENDFINYSIIDFNDACTNATYVPYSGNLANEMNALSNGEYKLCYYAEDLAGNKETPTNEQLLRLDDRKGTADIASITGNEVEGVFYSRNPIEIQAQLIDSESGIARTRLYVRNNNCTTTVKSIIDDTVSDAGELYTHTSIFGDLADGAYCVKVRGYDKAQNHTNVPTEQFVIDSMAPALMIMPSRAPDIGDWYSTRPTYSNTYPTFEILGTDPNLDKVEYKWNDGAWMEYTTDIDYKVDGKHTLYARATDLAGNVTENQLEVWFDFSNPEGTLTIDDSDGLVRQTIKLSFTDVEDPSGSEEISRIEIWADGYKGMATKVGEGIYEYDLDTTDLNDGDYTIRPSIFDMAGNRTRPSINITVDNTEPTPPSITIFDIVADILNVNADDVLSGTEKIEIKIDDGQWMTYTTNIDLNDLLNNEPGTYTIYIRVTDKAGNITEDSTTYTIPEPPAEDEEDVQGATDQNVVYAANLGTGTGTEIETDLNGEEETEEQVLGEESQTCENPRKTYGYIYHDKDTDGEIDDNEDRLEDISLRIYYMQDGEEMTVVTLQTDEEGYWETQLCPGTYTLEIDQEDIPEDLVLSETHEIIIEEDTEEYRLDLGATEDRNFWQKYWYLIVIGAGILVTITYLILSKGKKEETYQ